MHPIHISVTQIDYRPNEKSFQLTLKVFSDDLEQALLTHSGLNELPDNQDEVMFAYFSSVLKTKVNGKLRNYQWVGFETEDDAHFIFLEITGINKVKTLAISNQILFNIFDDQANIVHFQSGDTRKSELFQAGDGEKVIEL